jgi:Zn-dependent peptidase ImmA (M78 family)/transcriptional regulator with XRE-family HTH domain
MPRVAIKRELIRWAVDRASTDIEALASRPGLTKLRAWERGEVQPTMKQLEAFAKAVHVPLGYLFLPKPPEERLPIPDFRRVTGTRARKPTPELLDTIYAMQQRQAWLREMLRDSEADPPGFVGSARLSDSPAAVGREMPRIIGFGDGWAAEVRTWQDAVSKLRQTIEELGVMAVVNGVVGTNTHRKLDVQEFRGFALCDSHAPLIFVNGADAKSAQMFTLAHELAHVWLGSEGISGFEDLLPGGSQVEEFCDRAAAEFLVPARELEACWNDAKRAVRPFEELARRFKVSPIVAGRRAMDLRLVDRKAFFAFYRSYTAEERRSIKGPGGGDFYNNQNTRVGALFATSVIRAAIEGRVGFKEAYDLTGLYGGAFQEYAQRLGFGL